MNRKTWTDGIMAEVRNIESKNAQTFGAVVMPDRVSLMDISKPYAPVNVTVLIKGAISTWETACAVAYCRMYNYNIPDEVEDEDYADNEDWDYADDEDDEDDDYDEVLNWTEDDEDDDDDGDSDTYTWDDSDDEDDDILTLDNCESGDRVIIDDVVYIVCEIGYDETTVYNVSAKQREVLDTNTEVDEIL